MNRSQASSLSRCLACCCCQLSVDFFNGAINGACCLQLAAPLLLPLPAFDLSRQLLSSTQAADDAALLAQCKVNGKQPVVGILVSVEEVFLHCAKALKRSKLWEPDYRQDRGQMPTIARIILEQTCTPVAEPEAARIDAEVEEEYRSALY